VTDVDGALIVFTLRCRAEEGGAPLSVPLAVGTKASRFCAMVFVPPDCGAIGSLKTAEAVFKPWW